MCQTTMWLLEQLQTAYKSNEHLQILNVMAPGANDALDTDDVITLHVTDYPL